MLDRLALGTVQFGLPYGISNVGGQIAQDDVGAILGHARALGIDTLDTAIGYGDSENRLGQAGVERWRVVSKLPAVPETVTDIAAWGHESVAGSLDRLKLSRLYGLLLHRPQQLLGPAGDALYTELVALRDQGKVEKIGVSIYGPDELDTLCSRFEFDLVQAPFNIVDRRLATSGWLGRLREAGTEVHVRSVFLQGLLLIPAANRPSAFGRWQPLWDRWDRWLDEQALTPVQACLGFALAHPEVDRVIVGVDSLGQLREIAMSAVAPRSAPPVELISEDLDLLNPSRWNLH